MDITERTVKATFNVNLQKKQITKEPTAFRLLAQSYLLCL